MLENIALLNIPSNIKLTDPNICQDEQIDLLLSAVLFWEILRDGRVNLGKNKPILHNTTFGWVIVGGVNAQNLTKISHCHLTRTEDDVQDQLQRFWALETQHNTTDYKDHLASAEDIECEQFFVESTTRDKMGRFVLLIPFKDTSDVLEESECMATRRLSALERR
ncbi:hypothetical protein Trydic_g7750 [Trypoxylus dichotomus]